jgi:hypothetical protein
MRISFMSLHEVRVGALQTYSQSHKVEVTKSYLTKWRCMYTIFTISLFDFTLFAQNFVLLAYVVRPEVKVI